MPPTPRVPYGPGDATPPGPFTPGDPLSYDELPAGLRGWRSTIYLLADTGRTLNIPNNLAQGLATALSIAAGWRFAVTVTPHPTRPDYMQISASYTNWPEHTSTEDIKRWLTHGTPPPPATLPRRRDAVHRAATRHLLQRLANDMRHHLTQRAQHGDPQ